MFRFGLVAGVVITVIIIGAVEDEERADDDAT